MLAYGPLIISGRKTRNPLIHWDEAGRESGTQTGTRTQDQSS